MGVGEGGLWVVLEVDGGGGRGEGVGSWVGKREEGKGLDEDKCYCSQFFKLIWTFDCFLTVYKN